MSSKEQKKNLETDDNLTDNFAENMPNEPNIADSEQESESDSDNLAEECAKLKDSYIRLLAEYENYQKRTLREKADLIKNGGEKVLTGLLPIMDDFQRALENMEKTSELESLKEGVSLIYNKLGSFLSQNGVKLIETKDEPFDADLHEAVAIIPTDKEDQKGLILDTVQDGYTLNDKVIRHAKVVVAN